jgi:dolichyl-phosphate-mannose-protein mannosyltransferase
MFRANVALKINLRWGLPPLLLVTLFVVTGLRGIDFGFHWDEFLWQLLPAREMVTNGTFLSRPYNYPSLGRMLVLVPALGDGLRKLWHGGDISQILEAMGSAIDAPGYLLQARSVFLVVSALGIIWVYLAGWVLTGQWWQATLAAAILGLSWEMAYHARWLANDCLLAQFSALCLLLLVLHNRRGQAGWLWAAAIAAGLAAGTKYQGALLVVPVMLSGVLRTPATLRQRAASVVAIGALSVASYLITTPGTVLDPIVFTEGLAKEVKHYTTWHGGYTITAGFPHLGLLLRYLAFDLFSPYAPVAMLFFAFALVGGALSWRENRRLAAFLIGFPVLYATFFCWRYSVFIVRNVLLLAPFLALLSARGLAEALQRLRWRAARLALAIMVGCALAANAEWLISAGESIRHRDDGAAAMEAIAYVRNHSHIRFRISEKVAAMAAERGLTLPTNAVQANVNEVVFFAKTEGAPRPELWTVNDHWLTCAVFGPREINFNYYSNWAGSDRVVVMTLDKARAAQVPLAQ